MQGLCQTQYGVCTVIRVERFGSMPKVVDFNGRFSACVRMCMFLIMIVLVFSRLGGVCVRGFCLRKRLRSQLRVASIACVTSHCFVHCAMSS